MIGIVLKKLDDINTEKVMYYAKSSPLAYYTLLSIAEKKDKYGAFVTWQQIFMN